MRATEFAAWHAARSSRGGILGDRSALRPNGGPRSRAPAAAGLVEGSTRGGAPASHPAIADFLAAASATDESDPEPALTTDAPGFFPLGTTLVTFTATDDAGHATRCSAPLSVVDTTPPAFEATLATDVRSPAGHRLAPIDVSTFVSDVVDPDAGFTLVSIGSSDPDAGLGGGDLAKTSSRSSSARPTPASSCAPSGPRAARGASTRSSNAATDASGDALARVLEVRVEP